MFRVAATYVVASWLIIQVVTSVSEPLKFPEWFDAAVIVLLVIGFPIAVLLAWAFELTPEGIRATVSDGVAGSSGWRPLDTMLVIALTAVALVTGISLLASHDSPPSSAHKSVAVLPFYDMSPAGDQQHIGDGMAEEMLDELVRLDGLNVVSRTASFAYRDSDEDLRDIARSLGVATILEGSVRTNSDQLRVTAQLIDATDGYHIWSQTFDRPMSDIFAIQEEIAKSVAGALGVSLGVGDVNAFRGAGTTSVQAYEAYLRAMRLPFVSQGERIRTLERAVELDPNYGAALAALGLEIASTTWGKPPEEAPSILARAIGILMRAVETAPDSAYAASLLATVNYSTFEWKRSQVYFDSARKIQENGEILLHTGNMHSRAGRSKSALAYYEAALRAEHDPLDPDVAPHIQALLALGRYAEVEQLIGTRNNINYQLARLSLAINERNHPGVKSTIESISRTDHPSTGLLRDLLPLLESPAEAVALLRQTLDDDADVWPSKYSDIAILAAHFDDAQLALEAIANEARLVTIRYGLLWHPVMSEARKLRAFNDLMTEVNLVEYWRVHGWADHCRPLSDNDFECF